MGTTILPDFSGLPPEGQVVAYAVFAIALGMLFIAGRFGIKLRGLTPTDTKQTAVAAVVVDPQTLRQATIAIEALNLTFMQTNSVMRAKVKGDIASAREMKNLNESMSKVVDLLGQMVADQHAERMEAEWEAEVSRRLKERENKPRPTRRRQAPSS